jgi:hypothetical protein
MQCNTTPPLSPMSTRTCKYLLYLTDDPPFVEDMMGDLSHIPLRLITEANMRRCLDSHVDPMPSAARGCFHPRKRYPKYSLDSRHPASQLMTI